MKQWLYRFSASERTLEFLDERIRNLRSQLGDPRSAPFTGMPRGGGDKTDKIGRMLARVEELELQRREQTEKSRHLYDEIEEAISQIQGKRCPEMQAVLRMRHLDGADWETVCEMLFGKRDDFLDRMDTFKRKMFQLYRDALDAVANFIPEGGDEDDKRAGQTCGG